jgi:farnesyl-diphosphate farnesyltransferase
MPEKNIRYCREALQGVSRTFALGIDLLEDPLRDEVGIAYLVCRILDTIEDSTELPATDRMELLDRVGLQVFDPDRYRACAADIENLFRPATLGGPDHDLCRNAGIVLSTLHDLKPAARDAMKIPVMEMAAGMSKTIQRELSGQGLHLQTMEDLEQYCYYVAGTVGHLLTNLYVLDRPAITRDIEQNLRRHEVSFGLGLQVTNIIKGVTDDIARGVSYLPACLFLQAGISIDTLLDHPEDPRGREVLAGLVEWTLEKLDAALEYTLLLPVTEPDLRLFCGLPLAFAVRTLGLALESSAAFSEQALKISRIEVRAIHARMKKILDDNDKIRSLYMKEKEAVLVRVRP